MVRRKTESGLSIGIRSTLTSFQKGFPLIEKQSPSEFKIKIASTLEEREAVFHLAYKTYLVKGFINPNAQEWLVQNYDDKKETIILCVLDYSKKLAGSLTLVFDESIKLPAEKIYGEEIKTLHSKGEKLLEVSRLVISPEYRNTKEILHLLFNYMFIYSYHIKKYSAMVIEVNPKHKIYYKSLLKFDEIGAEKACPSVQNAPAILLHIPLSRYQSEVIRCANYLEQNIKERSLYPHFLKLEQEKLVVNYLEKQVKPMSSEEKIYFGFTESGINKAVCIA